jgi:hypothetical protein
MDTYRMLLMELKNPWVVQVLLTSRHYPQGVSDRKKPPLLNEYHNSFKISLDNFGESS